MAIIPGLAPRCLGSLAKHATVCQAASNKLSYTALGWYIAIWFNVSGKVNTIPMLGTGYESKVQEAVRLPA
jgi:hypothetical protein